MHVLIELLIEKSAAPGMRYVHDVFCREVCIEMVVPANGRQGVRSIGICNTPHRVEIIGAIILLDKVLKQGDIIPVLLLNHLLVVKH